MFSFLVVFLFVHFLKTQLTGICKRLGFAALDLSSPWEIAACTLGTQNNSDCGITRYRNSELALSFVILALFFFFKHSFFTPTYPLPAPVFSPWKCPSPFIPQTRWLIIAIVCWSAKKKNTLGRVFIKRHTCLTFGQQNGKSTPAVFLLSTALVSAEYTCSCGNVNLHERVVS